MKVVLAGYNTDAQYPSETPETISAAYARISRDPRPVQELREEAAREVAKARLSNRKIIFGFGHSSVAEHAVFNLDITGISRFAAEALQSFRLASFTEKSQRYIRLDGDWIAPIELDEDGRRLFDSDARRLFDLYGEALETLPSSGIPEESAREDARYLLPLCASCQMGMTANARELEHITRRLRAWPVGEIRQLAEEISSIVTAVAPSLFRHATPAVVDRFASHAALTPRRVPAREVALTAGDTDLKIGRYLLALSKGSTLGRTSASWRRLAASDQERLFRDCCEGLGLHDALPRAWELARFDFEIAISSTAFAQLKRHRMASIIASPPYPGSGITIPGTFREAGIESLLRRARSISESAARRLPLVLQPSILTNAHRRAVLVSMNARELIHFSRLREDKHAQWDIRRTASSMLALARRKAPLSLMPSGGKSEFEN